ncbi:Hsp20/alpha crystallin family protein [Oesophagostomum dentatum]|uniref:Hsp20/alpha crystallin family protein n=1 Tax=Oesophagostomum dentatum TaxID=61180 RepID=A0A0B1T9M2_OESDE|nr:Hsp20/alpha crystallin family protein [Oesophagostomum dentatum]
MAVCIFPTSVFPMCDNLFDEHDTMEKVLRLLRALSAKKDRGTSDQVTEDESKLSLTLDVSQFKPEELKVNLEGRTLIVEGKQETEDEQSYSMRSFVRHWVLPDNVDIEQIHSSLTSEGSLVIEAPKIVKPVKTARSIPILKAPEEKEPAKSA